MKEWTEELLLADGYKLQNAEITNVSLNFRDHGVLSLDLTLNGGESFTAAMFLDMDIWEPKNLKVLLLEWKQSCELWM